MASVGTTAGVLAETPPPPQGTLLPQEQNTPTNLRSKQLCWFRVFRSPQHHPQGGVGQHLTTDQCSGSGSGSGSSSWLWVLFFIPIYVHREKLRRTGWMKPEPAQGPGTGLLLD